MHRKKENHVHFADIAVQKPFAPSLQHRSWQDQILQMVADQGVIVSTVLLVKLVGGDICQIDLLVQSNNTMTRIFQFLSNMAMRSFKET